jgi:hypothetical protein
MLATRRVWIAIVAVAAILCLGVVVALLVGSPDELGSIRLSERDQGKTFHMQVGQQVVITLHQRGAYGPWTHPASADTTVVQPASDNLFPTRRVARGVFRAVKSGQTQVTAEAPAECEPPPCSRSPATFAVILIVDR